MSSAISGERLSPQTDRPGRRRRSGVARTGSGIAAAVLLGLLALAPGAAASGSPQGPPAGPTTPPFTQCPAIGLDTSCRYLVDVTNTDPKVLPRILLDSSQAYYDGSDDVTVAVQNDTAAPLSSIHMGVAGSADNVFGFDDDGACSLSISPQPEGCPFGPAEEETFGQGYGYYGPDAVLTADPNTTDSGTVSFPTALQPGQYTFFTLEAPPYGTSLTAGEVNDTISTTLNTTEGGEAFFLPSNTVAFPAPVNVSDTATISGEHASEATGKVKYRVYSDPNCTALAAEGGEKTVTNGVAEPSELVGKSLATNHAYYWQATYSGDAKNSEAVSVCGDEVMTFGTPPPPPQSSIATVLSGGGQVGAQITVPVGTAVQDTASVTFGGQPQGGRVTYYVFSDSSCTTQIKTNLGSVVASGGVYPASNAVTLPLGTYYFQAVYSGNGGAAGGRSPCGSEVLTVTTPPPPPTSQFTSVGNPQVNIKNGQIVVIGQFPAPGTATSTGVVTQGATLARVADVDAEAARKHKKCKRGYVKKGKKCVSNKPVPYGTTTLTIPTAGTYSIVIKPTSQVLKALKAGKKLLVVVSTTFQNRAGGTPVTHVQDVFVKLTIHKHGKRHHRRR